MRKTTAGLAAAALVTGGLALAGSALTGATANALPAPMPTYHWCPGDYWDPGWGFNWDYGLCHDDHHRDVDGADYSRDWWAGGQGPGQWGPPPPPPPWQPPWQPPWMGPWGPPPPP